MDSSTIGRNAHFGASIHGPETFGQELNAESYAICNADMLIKDGPFLRTLREAGILHELREASGRRSAILVFRELLNCVEGRTVLVSSITDKAFCSPLA